MDTCAPLYAVKRFFSGLFLTDAERKVRAKGMELFHVFNVDGALCCCCMEKLNKAEAMLALRVLKDESRWATQHRLLLTKIGAKLSQANEDRIITVAEFESAYAAAITETVDGMAEKVKAECAKEYEKMQRL